MRLEQPAHATGKKIVVIVGGGFAGLNAAKRLANEPAVHVVLVDQRNHHLFQPLTGRAASLAWLFVNLFYLIGFRNRAVMLSQWAWNYLFSKRESRLITEKEWRLRLRSE